MKVATHLSEDVQDILHEAKRCATKEKRELADLDILKALIRTSRLFTRQDALIKRAGSSPKRLWRIYQAQNITSIPSGLTVPDRASDIAQAAQAESGKCRVEIEHLLEALLDCPDPTIQHILKAGALSKEGLEKAIPKVKEESPLRFTLYCFREAFEVIVVVLFLVIVIKQGLGEFRLIPSESMVPTLQIGDRIVVEKVSHWYRAPQRGDVLVFYPPEPESILRQDPWSVFLRLTGFSGLIYDKDSRIDTAFIKRVVGLPGDIVDVRPGVGVFVNGKMLDEPYVNEIATTCTLITYCGPVKVPPHMYYMMGDNRNHSADSRYWQFLPADRIIGRAVFRFFPLDRIGSLADARPSPPQEITQ